MNEQELYQKALNKWGIISQINLLIEEMSELTKVLLHDRRNSKNVSIEDIAEEIVDVEIMLGQIKLWIPEEHMERMKRLKLIRLQQLLQN